MELVERERPELYDEQADPDVWADTAIGDSRLTWRELADMQRAELSRLRALTVILDDLDRCEHGRHEGDVCGGERGCNGPSLGNPIAANTGTTSRWKTADRQIGFTISGRPVVVPPRGRKHDPGAWTAGG